MRRAALLVGLTLLGTMIALPAFATTPDSTYLDTFGTQSFGGNDGDRDFSGPWIEMGESNGPTVGYVWVWDHPYCDGAFCLKMGGIDQEAAGHGAYRAVDLTGATWAKFSFKYGFEALDDDSEGSAVVQVSPDGGGSWTTLETVDLDSDDRGLEDSKSFDITEWATSVTLIRFMITEAENLELYWLIDNVTVQATFEGTSTTTTAPPTTVSTSTKPKATTSTTTTTQPRTTTTMPRTTTTTVPPVPGVDVPSEDHDTMMDKKGLAIVQATPPMAMPAIATSGDSESFQHAEPVEALAAAFFTDSGNYGGNLLPSIALGIVIAVVTLLGIGSRKED